MIPSEQLYDHLLYLLANDILDVATSRYATFVRVAGRDRSALVADIEDSRELLRVSLAENQRDLVLKAVNDNEAYLLSFGVDSTDVDFYKAAYFLCTNLSEIGDLGPIQKKIALMMAVTILDLFVRTDSGVAIPAAFVNKMYKSIFEGKNAEQFGEYGIYTVFKVASKVVPDA